MIVSVSQSFLFPRDACLSDSLKLHARSAAYELSWLNCEQLVYSLTRTGSVQLSDEASEASDPKRREEPSKEDVQPQVNSESTSPRKLKINQRKFGLKTAVRVGSPVALLSKIYDGEKGIKRIDERLKFRIVRFHHYARQ
jgi:hypothetical protein